MTVDRVCVVERKIVGANEKSAEGGGPGRGGGPYTALEGARRSAGNLRSAEVHRRATHGQARCESACARVCV